MSKNIISIRGRFTIHESPYGNHKEMNGTACTDFEIKKRDVELIDIDKYVAVLEYERFNKAMGFRKYSGVDDPLRYEPFRQWIPIYEINKETGIQVTYEESEEGTTCIISAALNFKYEYGQYLEECSENSKVPATIFIAQYIKEVAQNCEIIPGGGHDGWRWRS